MGKKSRSRADIQNCCSTPAEEASDQNEKRDCSSIVLDPSAEVFAPKVAEVMVVVGVGARLVRLKMLKASARNSILALSPITRISGRLKPFARLTSRS